MVFDPRSCLKDFFQTGRNIGQRPPGLSLRNIQRDIRSATTRLENIGDRVEGAIGAAARGEILPGQLFSIFNEIRCPPTAYANFFSQNKPPKFKFMFFMSFKLNPNFATAFGGNPFPGGEMWWFIKQASRPKIDYEYEDVNMYNFRQKILRRSTLNPIQLNIYDEMADTSAGFWNAFIKIQNPVTNITAATAAGIEDRGMNWADIDDYTRNLGQLRRELGDTAPPHMSYSASTGILPGINNGVLGSGNKNIIDSITTYHIIDWGRKFVAYEYINPRIEEITFDDLTYSDSEHNMIDISFSYDTFHIYMPDNVTEEFIRTHSTPLHPINPNLGETPFPAVNSAIDKFNTGVSSAVEGITEQVNSAIPGFPDLG